MIRERFPGPAVHLFYRIYFWTCPTRAGMWIIKQYITKKKTHRVFLFLFILKTKPQVHDTTMGIDVVQLEESHLDRQE